MDQRSLQATDNGSNAIDRQRRSQRKARTRDGKERSHNKEQDEGAGNQQKRGKRKATLAKELAASKEDGNVGRRAGGEDDNIGRGADSERGASRGPKRASQRPS